MWGHSGRCPCFFYPGKILEGTFKGISFRNIQTWIFLQENFTQCFTLWVWNFFKFHHSQEFNTWLQSVLEKCLIVKSSPLKKFQKQKHAYSFLFVHTLSWYLAKKKHAWQETLHPENQRLFFLCWAKIFSQKNCVSQEL